MTNSVRSLIRTITPMIVGFGASLLAHIGISQPAVVSAIGTAVSIGYYSLVRIIEHKYPRAGVLLGAVGAPTYPAKIKP